MVLRLGRKGAPPKRPAPFSLDRLQLPPPWSHRLSLLSLVLLPVLLFGCQALQKETSDTKKNRSTVSTGDKGRSVQEKRARASRLALLPEGSSHPWDAHTDESTLSVQRSWFTLRDTVFSILKANNISLSEIARLIQASRSVHPLSRIGAGNWYQLVQAPGGLREFLVQVDTDRQLRIYRSQKGSFRARMERIPYEIKLVRLRVKVRHSFLRSVVASGGSPLLAMELEEIFEWVVDFHKDLHEGDRVDILVERRYLEGRPSGFGRIMAASFRVGDRTHSAVYYDGGRDQYYTPQGNTLRRAFLRSPLKYTRISSHYSKRRFHPILKRFRPHLGVDYAAPTGTPVRAVGDGLADWADWNGAAGKMVRLKHPLGYTTEYLHLSRFAKGIKPGKRVRQGQVIGYVGSTGLSTGPHLDFRLKRFGQPINPLSANLPVGNPIHSAFELHFRRTVRKRDSQFVRAPLLKPSKELMAASDRPRSKDN